MLSCLASDVLYKYPKFTQPPKGAGDERYPCPPLTELNRNFLKGGISFRECIKCCWTLSELFLLLQKLKVSAKGVNCSWTRQGKVCLSQRQFNGEDVVGFCGINTWLDSQRKLCTIQILSHELIIILFWWYVPHCVGGGGGKRKSRPTTHRALSIN